MVIAAALAAAFADLPAARATDWHVAPGGAGDGRREAPFGRIQDALAAAQPGDVIHLAAGTYAEALWTTRGGTTDRPITLRAAGGRGTAVVTARGRVATIAHPHIVLDGLVLDGQFGPDDIVRVGGGAAGFTLRNSEVRRGGRDGIDMGAARGVLIEDSLVHHTLNAANGRSDAHGIVAGAAAGLTIRRTEIHTFSGDAFQIDPGRAAPGWSDVLIEDCRFWLRPLPEPVNGFAAGVVPGENAIDTKVGATLPRAKLTIRQTEAYGFRGGLIGNMAAFNIKEGVDTLIDGVTIHGSEIAFRLRAPAHVWIQNAVVHSVTTAIRYENDIQGLSIFNSTFGMGITRLFQAASSAASVLEVQNVAIVGGKLPPEASRGQNLVISAKGFVDAARHDYRLVTGSPAIDKGQPVATVVADREKTPRPQGGAWDVGAYEWRRRER